MASVVFVVTAWSAGKLLRALSFAVARSFLLLEFVVKTVVVRRVVWLVFPRFFLAGGLSSPLLLPISFVSYIICGPLFSGILAALATPLSVTAAVTLRDDVWGAARRETLTIACASASR